MELTQIKMPVPKFGRERIPVVELSATRTPKGKVVLTEFGVTDDPSGPELVGITRAKALGVLGKFKYMKGIDVGLEWRTVDGKRLPTSFEWAENSWVAVKKLEGDEREGRFGELITPSAFNKRKRLRSQAEVDALSAEEYEQWREDIEEMHTYLTFVKHLNLEYGPVFRRNAK